MCGNVTLTYVQAQSKAVEKSLHYKAAKEYMLATNMNNY